MKEEIRDLQTEKNYNIPAIGGSALVEDVIMGGLLYLSIYVNSFLGRDHGGNRQF